MVFSVECYRVHAGTDGQGGDHSAAGCVHYRHHLAPAPDKQAGIFGIDGESGRRLASRDRIFVGYGEGLRIEADEGGFLLQVHEPGAVTGPAGAKPRTSPSLHVEKTTLTGLKPNTR